MPVRGRRDEPRWPRHDRGHRRYRHPPHPARGVAETIIAKATQDALARLLATELAGDGIRVNIVAPGVVPTVANAGEHQQAMIDAAAAQAPLGCATTATTSPPRPSP